MPPARNPLRAPLPLATVAAICAVAGCGGAGGKPDASCCDPAGSDSGGTADCAPTLWYADRDGDGHGAADDPGELACGPVYRKVESNDDCDDASSAARPGLFEACDRLDNDCDGEIDEGASVGAIVSYADGDADGYGDDRSYTSSCELPEGHAVVGGDCDDDRADVNPGRDEDLSDGLDNNCDGWTDLLGEVVGEVEVLQAVGADTVDEPTCAWTVGVLGVLTPLDALCPTCTFGFEATWSPEAPTLDEGCVGVDVAPWTGRFEFDGRVGILYEVVIYEYSYYGYYGSYTYTWEERYPLYPATFDAGAVTLSWTVDALVSSPDPGHASRHTGLITAR